MWGLKELPSCSLHTQGTSPAVEDVSWLDACLDRLLCANASEGRGRHEILWTYL